MAREFWNKMFGQDEYRYGTEPNAFLKEQASRVFPAGGRIVCLGDGEGRNSVWLATQGFDVTAVDPSDVGLQKTHALAEARSVEVRSFHGIAQDFPETGFDGVVLIFLHAPPENRTQIHDKAQRLLKPGGALLLEGFTPEQRLKERTSGGPQDIDMLFTEEILRQDFADLEIEHLESLEAHLREGPGHQGVANLVRMVARRV